MFSLRERLAVALCVSLATFFSLKQTLAADDSLALDFFESKIRPILVQHCYECHSGKSAAVKGGLRLDDREQTRKGGESGPAVVPKQLDASLIISALRFESVEMPPSGKLPENVIKDFERWIEMGAPDPRESAATSHPTKANGKIDWETAGQFWSFQLPQRIEAPHVANSHWISRPIDAFVASRLEQAGLQPNEPADRRTLLRRLAFDTLGLPPSFEEVEAFVNDASPNAYERVVERLLSSEHFGERWARLWLDVARFAEDQAHIVGDNKELFYPNAYLYRDWVVQAFNHDMPYDEFIRQQIAGDLINPHETKQLAALGFIGLGPKYYRRNALDVMAEEWEDRVDTVTRGLLGLTVACARCHDHKYDPIPTEDYYALAGVFCGTEMFNKPLDAGGETKENGQAKNPEQSMHIVRDTQVRDLRVMIRGDVENEGDLVRRGFLRVLSNGESKPFRTGSGRLELAYAIASPKNPLTARVIINRVWGQYFGQPLVDTPSNFGQLGSKPTHPELLDDLAVRFMDNGWSLKWLHREIIYSSTYRQSSRFDTDKAKVDPANKLMWRVNRKRLSVESWRDSLLSASGVLNRSIGGSSIQASAPNETRRTLYSYISRFQLDPLLTLLDFPDPNTHSERRSQTTTALQKLFSMNSPLMVRLAKEFAGRLTQIPNTSDRERIVLAYRSAFSRDPDQHEAATAIEFLQAGENADEQWERFTQVLLASNEMLIID